MKKFLGDENIFDDPDTSFGVVIPIPYEFSTSYGKGTANGPAAIIEASQYVELYDEELDCEPYKNGILTSASLTYESDPVPATIQIKNQAEKYLGENKFIIALGGEHTISQALVEACNKKYSDLSILQLDAHADLRDSYEGSRYSHACVMKRIWESNQNIVQCGIRSLSKEEALFIRENKIDTFFAHELKKMNDWEKVISKLNDDVYLTIDVDFFDPSVMPATGTPEPGGFYWDETIRNLKKLFTSKNVIACDIVELSPEKELRHADFMISRLIYKIFGFKQRYMKI